MPHDDAARAVDLVREEPQRDGAHRAPGTFVLALIFLATFAAYFFANWIALSDVWHVR